MQEGCLGLFSERGNCWCIDRSLAGAPSKHCSWHADGAPSYSVNNTDILQTSLTTNNPLHSDGDLTSTIVRLPLRLPPHCTCAAAPTSSTDCQSNTTSATPSSITTPRRSPPHSQLDRRHMGWPAPCGAQKEDITPEDADETIGGEGTEGRHGVEQVQLVWEDEEGARTLSVLCAE